ncbi:MAG TPA: cupin domain-containing protein [Vicinamibacteria bacterium]
MKVFRCAAAGLGLLALAVTGSTSGPASRDVVHLSAETVSAAFAKGKPLVEVENYKVHASRREAAGQVEVHTRDTDIIHVLTGTATFVTGGAIVGGKDVEPEEIRGTSIDGGQARELRPGEVVIVPSGTPHWFKEVPAPMTYYVVKVRAAGAAR